MEKDQIDNSRLQFILIGGSAGSLQVILYLLDNLRPSFTISMLFVLHRDPRGSSRLAELFRARTYLQVKEIEDKDSIETAHIYLCPADYHVLVEQDQTFSLDYSEKEHFSRPSIDVAVRAAADTFGEKLLCILLSGANADGASGLAYAKGKKSITIIQEPVDAQVSYMPEQAMMQHVADHIFPTKEIVAFINSL